MIGGLGLWHIMDEPGILWALNPYYAVEFLVTHGVLGLFVLGAVFLTVTGAEALTADMGHFGLAPIRLGWFALVWPALVLNYLGQGAYALNKLEAVTAAGQKIRQRRLVLPDGARFGVRPLLVVLATCATIIASQAVITGAYSLTQQAVQLGLLPRLRIRNTSADYAGQIYLTVDQLAVADRRSGAGRPVPHLVGDGGGLWHRGDRHDGRHHLPRLYRRAASLALVAALGDSALILPLLTLDLIFFGANILRVIEGGWVPLVIAACIGFTIFTWVRGKSIVRTFEQRQSVPLADLAAALTRRPPERVEGTAIFLTGNPHRGARRAAPQSEAQQGAPRDQPDRVGQDHRHAARARLTNAARSSGSTTISASSCCATASWKAPIVPHDLAAAAKAGLLALDPMKASYFIGRNTLKPDAEVGMPLWQDRIFMFLQRNASDPTDFLRIPPGKVLELGEQVTVWSSIGDAAC